MAKKKAFAARSYLNARKMDHKTSRTTILYQNLKNSLLGRNIKNKEQKLVPDKGWCWVMLVAGCVLMFLVFGVHYTYGILYPNLLKEFKKGEGKTGNKIGDPPYLYLKNGRFFLTLKPFLIIHSMFFYMLQLGLDLFPAD